MMRRELRLNAPTLSLNQSFKTFANENQINLWSKKLSTAFIEVDNFPTKIVSIINAQDEQLVVL